ncbi:MAG: tRNA 2-selenouridine(34) synthase MnmH [Jaaginema sp. PMC 1079.18]|nr:tRNA 2-selenouridine(34) synthase MnmH [Jaaginema sp. PMC 1080.18]MEC4851511.1 tRNA 2-selenouridine(34) synthase MnmH [Jaaginema sp. PMC 1079.18]MEC4868009.1 tRNA 2-selenouridine(34) synthase MnmH [Jaaginema sp. PMC 1078.18]
MKYTTTPNDSRYSEIIDVRSPWEFQEDHVPGAINLPVLDDEERSRVGTLYKQESPFVARKVGAALISRRIARHLENHFSAKDKDYHPLVYCWRGGTRSQSLALVLEQIGWQVTVLTGGYKTYRTAVRQQLAILPQQFEYKILSGLTGVGKTAILQQLAQLGEQVLDLEAIAHHRGSILGHFWDEQPQPSQKRFESLLLQQFQTFEPHKIVWLEAESSKIGLLHLPPQLWEMMQKATAVGIQLPLEMRVEGLLQQYPHLTAHPQLLKQQLSRLQYRYGKAKVEQWYDLINSQQWRVLVRDLLVFHYDRAYTRSLQRRDRVWDYTLTLTNLSTASVVAAAISLRDGVTGS